MELQKHTRRDFIRLTGLSAAGLAIAACAREPEIVETIVRETVVVEKEVQKEVTVVVEKEVVKEAPTAVPAPTPVPSKYQESPMLAERVARGELPPVDERLPEEPRVCPVIEEIGQYGGAITVASLSSGLFGGDAGSGRAMDCPNWLRISRDITGAVPHILRDWEVSPDYTEVTCHMRKGMKWSDGALLTSADIQFWHEDILANTEVTPVANEWFRWGGELMQLTVIDDYTYKLTFAQPHPSFVIVCMAHLYGFWGNQTFVPAHYLRQFHIKYNDKAGDLAKQAGFDFWYQLLGREINRGQSIERPRLETYVPLRDTPSMTFWERNPYYHAVDPEGNQLPYIDSMNVDRCADLSIMDAKVVGGTYDFAAQELRILFYATYAEAAAASDARMLLWPSGKGGEVVYNVNMNWEDDEWREVFTDDRFRQALSLAIDRRDINNVIYFGNAAETQMTVIPVSRHYRPEFAEAYAEHDLDRANELLDEMGLEWNAARTHRLWPQSRQPIIIAWDLCETETPKGPITELVTEYWKRIGIEIQWKSITRSLLNQKVLANEEPMSLWHGDETADTLFLRRSYSFVPYEGDECTWGILWGRWWNTRGEAGEEPPEYIKQLFEWQEEYNITDDDEPARKVLASQAEHVWTIGTVGMAPHPLFVRNYLRNVTEGGGFWTWDSLWAYPEFPEQWFFRM
jgi:peptide/nickel transport system substrate-binding protein